MFCQGTLFHRLSCPTCVNAILSTLKSQANSVLVAKRICTNLFKIVLEIKCGTTETKIFDFEIVLFLLSFFLTIIEIKHNGGDVSEIIIIN
jgi:multisubunit Na+/H+ antiporter MnhF subunit